MSNRLLQLLERFPQRLQKPPPRILDWLAESMVDLRALKRRAVTFAIDRKSHSFATRLSLKLASDIMEIWFPNFGCRRLSFTATAQASLPFPLILWMDGTFLLTCLANFMVHSCSAFAAKNVRRDTPNSAAGWQQQKKVNAQMRWGPLSSQGSITEKQRRGKQNKPLAHIVLVMPTFS